MRQDFEIIDTTADIGVHARGDTLEELLSSAACGMLEVMGIYEPGEEMDACYEMELWGEREDWLVDILTRILQFMDTDGFFLCDAAIELFPEEGKANINGQTTRKRPVADVKAVTYHDLRVDESSTGFSVKVIFDV